MQGLEILQYKISPNCNPKSTINPRSPYCVLRLFVGYALYMYKLCVAVEVRMQTLDQFFEIEFST